MAIAFYSSELGGVPACGAPSLIPKAEDAIYSRVAGLPASCGVLATVRCDQNVLGAPYAPLTEEYQRQGRVRGRRLYQGNRAHSFQSLGARCRSKQCVGCAKLPMRMCTAVGHCD